VSELALSIASDRWLKCTPPQTFSWFPETSGNFRPEKRRLQADITGQAARAAQTKAPLLTDASSGLERVVVSAALVQRNSP
jgi:hypothetical protein